MKIMVVNAFLFILFSCQATIIEDKKIENKAISSVSALAELNDTLPDNIQKLMEAYPDFIVGGTQNSVIWSDGSEMVFDDGKIKKSYEENLNFPDLADQFLYSYPKGLTFDKLEKNNDAGRIRYEPFFYKMYGKNKQEVEKNLVEVIWLPKSAKQSIKVTKINNVAEKVKAISEELENLPALQKYLKNIGGTFNWRLISGTNRISTHSFGMTIDINTEYSNYWQWDCKCKNEDADLSYKNKIPMEIVEIFEKYGFIWGGKWYHYDTMHFEYGPELII